MRWLESLRPREGRSRRIIYIPGLDRYFDSSIKGQAEIDWDDADARLEFLRRIVHDANHLLAPACEALERLRKKSDQTKQVLEAGALMAAS